MRVVHDHYIAVLGVKAHDLIGADALAGVHKPRGCGYPLFQALYHIQGPGGSAEMDRSIYLKAFSASQVVRAERPIARLLLGNAICMRIVDGCIALADLRGDIVFRPLSKPQAAGIDALCSELALQRADPLLSHHIGDLRLVAGLGPNSIDLIDVDIDLRDGSHRYHDLSRSGGQSSADAARLSSAGGSIYHQNALISSAHHIIDCVQHPVLVRPERLIGQIIQVHRGMIPLGTDKCYP